MNATGLMAAAMNPNLSSEDLCGLIDRDTEAKIALLHEIEKAAREILAEFGREARVQYMSQSLPLLFVF